MPNPLTTKSLYQNCKVGSLSVEYRCSNSARAETLQKTLVALFDNHQGRSGAKFAGEFTTTYGADGTTYLNVVFGTTTTTSALGRTYRAPTSTDWRELTTLLVIEGAITQAAKVELDRQSGTSLAHRRI